MLKTYDLSKKLTIYYDVDRQTIARTPTKANLLSRGSDNSLYFGITTNEAVCKIFCDFFKVNKIEEINSLNYDMSCGGEIVNVVINLNAEGQIQIKICKDGTIGRLTSNFAFAEMVEYDFTKMLLVVDFKHKEIRFKDPYKLEL